MTPRLKHKQRVLFLFPNEATPTFQGVIERGPIASPTWSGNPADWVWVIRSPFHGRSVVVSDNLIQEENAL